MPQGPGHWHEHWDDDGKALEYLDSRGFTVNGGGMIMGCGTIWDDLDVLDRAAICYLIDEWDYGWLDSATQGIE
jgi:hypothetical protein